ncbi:MAG: winged helix-turn-helix domain-containing protein, partial [Pseudomonadota bacterium]
MNSELLQGFYLGDLLVEPLKGQVTGTTGSVHIPPKAMEVLLCLANDPGELVTREHLITEVWGEGHGSAETLSHAVSEIRHALDDHPEEPVFIQTLPRRGYRLVVAPELASEHSSTIILGTQNGATVADVSLLENLKRRGVLETAIAYLIVGWLLIQIADIVFAQLLLPTWAGTFVTVLVIAGFPIAILLSWFLEFRDGKAVVDLSPLDARRRRFSRTYLSVISALGAAALLVYMFDQFVGLPEQGSTIAADTGDTDLVIADNTIAVLPFMNVDGSDESETFANGFVDDVINRLAHVPGLLVSSRGDAFTMQPNSASGDVRQRLRVARYLEGSVQMTGDRIRIMVQLIDSSTGFHVLSRTFDRDREDFFEIRDEVTELTVSSLRVTLPEDTQQLTATTTPGPNLDAYILYRRGVDEMHKPTSQETVASALDWFDAALEVDDEYAAAYAGKCDAHSQAYDIFKDPAVVPDAEADCARALALNPNLDIVHTALGQLYALVGDNEKARISFETALQQNDRSVPALIGLAEVQYALQDAAAAEETVEKAIGLQPGNWKPANWLGLFMYHQGRYKEAAEQFAAVVDLDPDNTLAVANLGASYMLSGEF